LMINQVSTLLITLTLNLAGKSKRPTIEAI
jgi:hypothetical protein